MLARSWRLASRHRNAAAVERAGLVAEQEALLEAWRNGDHDLVDATRLSPPRVLRIDDPAEAGGLAPDGSLVLIAWVAGCQPASDLVAALEMSDTAARATAQQELQERAEATERATEGPRLAAVVTLRWGEVMVATLPIDARLGFSLVRVPYHGGRLDVRGFCAEVMATENLAVEVVVLLRPPWLSPVEGEALRLIEPRNGRPIFHPEPLAVFGKIAKAFDRGAKDVGHAVEKGAKVVGKGVEKGAEVVGKGVEQGAKVAGIDAKNVAKAGQEVAKGVARVVVQQNKVAMQQEAEGHQGVGPGAEGAGGADDAAGGAEGAADDAADAAEAAVAVAGAFARPHVFVAGGDFGLGPEPDAETLLAYRNRVLRQRP